MGKSPEVERWLASFEHPLKDAILRVRQIILSSHKEVEECIKWKSPTFTFCGNIASINPKTKKKVSLMFHQGAQIPGKHPHLVGGGGTVKYMYFDDAREVESRRPAIQSVVRAWCKMKVGEGKTTPGRSKARAASKKKRVRKAGP